MILEQSNSFGQSTSYVCDRMTEKKSPEGSDSGARLLRLWSAGPGFPRGFLGGNAVGYLVWLASDPDPGLAIALTVIILPEFLKAVQVWSCLLFSFVHLVVVTTGPVGMSCATGSGCGEFTHQRLWQELEPRRYIQWSSLSLPPTDVGGLGQAVTRGMRRGRAPGRSARRGA